MRTWILGLLLLAATALAGDRGIEPTVRTFGREITFTPRSSPFLESHRVDRDREKPVECCKVCTKGKPCGDTCIDRDKECRVGAGCAC